MPPLPPDLGPGAAVCGRPDDIANTDEAIAQLVGCEIYEGSLRLTSGVTDLSPLISLHVVRGTISTGSYNNVLKTLEGLDSIEWAGSFALDHDSVNSVAAMQHLIGVEDDVEIQGMLYLAEVRGLEELRTVGRNVYVRDNPEIADLGGLEGLEWIGGGLMVSGNQKLASLAGLAALKEVAGDVRIYDNPILPQADIDAFVSRIEIGGEVHFE